jgi:hypothetical protein
MIAVIVNFIKNENTSLKLTNEMAALYKLGSWALDRGNCGLSQFHYQWELCLKIDHYVLV